MIAKRVRQGDLYPVGYGLAYYNYNSYHAICYPLGLNILVRAVRKLWVWVMSGSAIGNDRILKAYLRGRSIKGDLKNEARISNN